ncbi:bidirectional sugar transporter SWEET17-like isoform X2 [Juglans microcarpa x Juglans regia]|uniref:bidirectional sugar transporter SWEET17-like isoform X2 n=1 Tax=Juglans microcarpa x Juglans regia TaxID=2249226 RepID=UPI001B7E59DC|nr:bidirectional sugar transporter SWEET17-like isoform X2 [Juglans microcarpa x Juglans regia]
MKLIFLSMISLVYFTGVLGNIMSGLVYLSPTPTFWRIVKRRSTEEFESLPYICKLLNAYFWVYYGLIKPDSLLVATVNMFGAVVEIIFLFIFLLYAPPGMKARTAILVAILDVGFPAAAVLLTQFLLHGEVRIDVAGLLCVGFSMIAYASPLSAMKTVVTTKSVEYMPFLLSFILFLNGGVWTFYAFLTKDWFVGTPNGTGFLLGTAQLILYAIYWKPKPSKQQVLNNEDLEDNDTRQREPLIIPAAGSQSVNAVAEM